MGERLILNFGHTLGHALEAHYGFETYGQGEWEECNGLCDGNAERGRSIDGGGGERGGVR